MTKWQISDDDSIEGPERGTSSYYYFPIEARSPAYYFQPSSLKAIEKAVALLSNSYCCHLGESSGLDVDLGNGSEGFKFEEVQHLMALLWAFEPQLNTLHPSDRLDNKHCKSLRDKSVFARTFKNQHARRPTPQEGAAHLLNNRYEELIQLSGDRNSPCNFYNLLYVTTSDVVKTFEFRQHRGVLDPSAVSNWVQTLIGVVDFIQHITPNALLDVLS